MERTAITNHLQRWFTLAAFAVAAALIFSLAFTPLRTSHDEFWQLKTGQWIAQHGRLPQFDIFAYTTEHVPWHNHEWLSQLLLWGTYQAGEGSTLGGWRAVILLKAAVLILAFAGFGALLARPMRQPVWAALAAALAADLGRRTFYPRPPFITCLLLALTLWLLIEWRADRLRSRWLALVLIPLFALWSNLHGGWMAGLTIVGAFAANQTWLVLLKRRGVRQTVTPERRLLAIALILGGCILATLANPFGYQLWALPGRVMADPYLARQIGEMAPPDWHFVWVLEGVILLMAAIAIRPVTAPGLVFTGFWLLALHLALRAAPGAWVQTAIALPVLALAIFWLSPPGWVAHLLLVCFYGFQAIHHVRHLLLFGVVILPPLAWGLEAWVEAFIAHWSNRPLSRPAESRERIACHLRLGLNGAGLLAVSALAVFLVFYQYERPTYFERNQLLAQGTVMQPRVVVVNPADRPIPSALPTGAFYVDAPDYPVQAVNFILRAGLPKRLWNGGNYCGYLMWRLAPEHYKVFTDNRYDIFGADFIRQEHAVLNGWTRAEIDSPQFMKYLASLGVASRSGFLSWDQVLDRWGVQTVILPADARGNARLYAAGWARVYEDFCFIVWVRNTPANRPVIEKAQSLPRPAPARAKLF